MIFCHFQEILSSHLHRNSNRNKNAQQILVYGFTATIIAILLRKYENVWLEFHCVWLRKLFDIFYDCSKKWVFLFARIFISSNERDSITKMFCLYAINNSKKSIFVVVFQIEHFMSIILFNHFRKLSKYRWSE